MAGTDAALRRPDGSYQGEARCRRCAGKLYAEAVLSEDGFREVVCINCGWHGYTGGERYE